MIRYFRPLSFSHLGSVRIRVLLPFVLIIVLVACIDSEAEMGKKGTYASSNPSIALLGTFHFGGTTDYSSMDLDNFDSQKRQLEIEQLVDALVEFKPTKILLECTLKDEILFQDAYRNYKKHQTKLKMDEREQIGFRLASELNLPDIHCIDYKLPLPMDSLSNFAHKNRKPEFLSFLATIEKNDQNDSKVLAASTIKQYYAFKNSEEEDLKNKRLYIQETAKFVSDSTDIGIKFVSLWWERNLHIMSNIDQHIGYTGRVLVLVGGAHRAVLKDFYQDRDDVNYIEIADYLQ